MLFETRVRTALHGTARQGTARHGTARQGTARHGKALHGTARQGTARHGLVRVHRWSLCCRKVVQRQITTRSNRRPVRANSAAVLSSVASGYSSSTVVPLQLSDSRTATALRQSYHYSSPTVYRARTARNARSHSSSSASSRVAYSGCSNGVL